MTDYYYLCSECDHMQLVLVLHENPRPVICPNCGSFMTDAFNGTGFIRSVFESGLADELDGSLLFDISTEQ